MSQKTESAAAVRIDPEDVPGGADCVAQVREAVFAKYDEFKEANSRTTPIGATGTSIFAEGVKDISEIVLREIEDRLAKNAVTSPIKVYIHSLDFIKVGVKRLHDGTFEYAYQTSENGHFKRDFKPMPALQWAMWLVPDMPN